MLFNSYPFLFVFLPIALLGYQIAAHWHRHAVVIWLSIASLAFYGYWRPVYLILLCASILVNYLFGSLISRKIPNRVDTGLLLTAAIVINIGALCYFKYLFPSLNFLAAITGSSYRWKDVFLPLGISFFTFTQIAYLVDLQQETVRHQDLGSYTLFATFFPHLIAGPILHHAEVMPQFQQQKDYRLRADDVAVGFAWFSMGLFKKVLLADNFAPGADAMWAATHTLSAPAAWAGVLSYALQLYFDFSGYSDMALGLARMFSIDFPLNFSSPYKATNIVNFWQRWHMTLTRYINAYLYNPVFLWVNRRRLAKGRKVSRKAMATPSGFLAMSAMPTMFSFFIAGVWHGAGLQFLVFGVLHGIFLSTNQGWRTYRTLHPRKSVPGRVRGYINQAAAVLLTFVSVLIGQVFFRAPSVAAGCSVVAKLVGLHHHMHSVVETAITPYHPSPGRWASIVAGLAIVWAFPNTQQILRQFKPALSVTRHDEEGRTWGIAWRPNAAWGLALGLALFYTVVKLETPSSFLYFQF